jgi:hypothetical protein
VVYVFEGALASAGDTTVASEPFTIVPLGASRIAVARVTERS